MIQETFLTVEESSPQQEGSYLYKPNLETVYQIKQAVSTDL